MNKRDIVLGKRYFIDDGGRELVDTAIEFCDCSEDCELIIFLDYGEFMPEEVLRPFGIETEEYE